MTWYLYKTPFSDEQLVMCPIDDGTVISGRADSVSEYLAWVAAGNTAQEWQPEDAD